MTIAQLQLLIASTNEQIVEPAVFWSWTGVLAICTGLVLIGLAIDWLLRRRHKDHILLKMSELQDKLERLPVRDWQMVIAKMVIVRWQLLGLLGSYVLITLGGRAVGRFRNGLATLYLGPGLVLLALSFTGYPAKFWFVIIVLAGLTPNSLFFLSLTCEAASQAFFNWRSISWANFNRWFGIKMASVALVSSIFSLVALLIGVLTSDGSGATYWFSRYDGSLYPTRPLTLMVLNIPFDFLTIWVSILLLALVVNFRRFFILAAAVDIVISAAIVIAQHASLGIIESVDISTAGIHIDKATHWFIGVLTLNASSTDPNWPLTPILLTSFIPVTLYMSAFLFLGIIVKPFARTAAYLCGLLWEKEQTPFLVFAVALSGMLTLTKAFSEWKWLVEKLGG